MVAPSAASTIRGSPLRWSNDDSIAHGRNVYVGPLSRAALPRFRTMVEKLNVLVDGGKATPGPPLGPALGPLGLNIVEIIKAINEKTKSFEGMKVPVTLIVDPKSKAFTIEVGTPPTSALIAKELKIEKGSGDSCKTRVGNLSLAQAIKIAGMKADTMQAKFLKAPVRVREPGGGQRPSREVELHAHVPSEEASEFREVRAVRLVQDDPHDSSGAAEGVEQEPQDLGGDGERTHAKDLSAAGKDHLAELATDRLRPLVDPEVRLALPCLRGDALLQPADHFGRGDEIVPSRLMGFFRDDSRRTCPISVRALPRHLDPAFRLQGR